MKTIFTAFFFCLFLNGFAQNYDPLYSSSDGFYEASTTLNTKLPLEKVSIDSVKVSGQDSTFYPFKKLGTTLNTASTISPCYNLFINSWLGSKIIVGNDSTIFHNNNNEPIYLNHSAKLGDSTILHHDGSVYLETKMISMVYQNIPGIGYDSVKKFIVIAKNTLGRPLNSNWENDTLLLSKNHGLISSYRWDIFPTIPHTIQSLVDINYLRIDEIYDYNIGDIFHYEGENTGIKNYKNITISNKWFSPNSDTIHYERLISEEIQDPNGTIFNLFNDTISITNLDSLLNSPLVPTRPNRLSANEITTFNMSRNYYNQRQFEEVVTYDHQVTVDSNCYSPQNNPNVNLFRVIKGAGAYSSVTSSGNINKDSLIYFKKGNETWGNPRVVTRLNNHLQKNSYLNIFPNPTDEYVTVTSFSNITEFKVFTLDGKLVKDSEVYQNNLKIELPKAGVYIIQFLDENGNKTQHKIIKQ